MRSPVRLPNRRPTPSENSPDSLQGGAFSLELVFLLALNKGITPALQNAGHLITDFRHINRPLSIQPETTLVLSSSKNANPLSITKDGDVRVVRRKKKLSSGFGIPQLGNNPIRDESVI
nr:hypothetical protein [Pseudomonas anguilliseptica]